VLRASVTNYYGSTVPLRCTSFSVILRTVQ
jgi:hypothetical protein